MLDTATRVTRLASANAQRVWVKVMREPPVSKNDLYRLDGQRRSSFRQLLPIGSSQIWGKLAAIAVLGMLEKRAVSLGVARLQSEEFPSDFNAGQVILPYLLTAFVQEKQRLLAFFK